MSGPFEQQFVKIASSELVIRESRFNFGQFEPFLDNDLNYTYPPPPVVFKIDERFHLLEGANRVSLNDSSVDVVELFSTDPLQLTSLIIAYHRNWILENGVHMAEFYSWYHRNGGRNERFSTDILPLLGLGVSQDLIRRLRIVSDLNSPAKKYLASKGASLKQCSRLERYSNDLIDSIVGLSKDEPLSFGNALQLFELLFDHTRRFPGSLAQVMKGRGVAELKTFLLQQKYPTLTQVNREIEARVESMGLPRNVSVSWDSTLENPQVTISAVINRRDDLSSLKNVFGSDSSLQLMEGVVSLL
jgi:hypothetical protein